VRFPCGAIREKGILELVHSDVFRHVSVPSLGVSLYYVSFIEYFSRKTWIYLLRNKPSVFDKFKEFKSLVENQTDKNIKVLITDNGDELCGKDFQQFYKQCGITRQNTTPYSPKQIKLLRE
jgi:transposase